MSTWTLVGTLPGGAGGTINVHPQQSVGISQQTVADLGRPGMSAGVAVAESPKILVTQETPGISVTASASGAPNQVALTPGVALSNTASGGQSQPQSVGAELVRLQIDLTQTRYAGFQTSTGTWSNGASSLGAPNSFYATNANGATTAASGTLTINFGSQDNKTELTITSVIVSLYWKNVAGLVLPGTWKAEYSLDGGTNWTTLVTGTTSFTKDVTPDTFDLTSVVGQDWAKLTNMRIRFTYTASASATPSTLSVDAIKLSVLATRTDLL